MDVRGVTVDVVVGLVIAVVASCVRGVKREDVWEEVTGAGTSDPVENLLPAVRS